MDDRTMANSPSLQILTRHREIISIFERVIVDMQAAFGITHEVWSLYMGGNDESVVKWGRWTLHFVAYTGGRVGMMFFNCLYGGPSDAKKVGDDLLKFFGERRADVDDALGEELSVFDESESEVRQ